MFDNHFLQLGQKMQRKHWINQKKYHNYLNERVENSFIIETTHNDDVLSAIKQFKNDKATSTNSRCTLLMKK